MMILKEYYLVSNLFCFRRFIIYILPILIIFFSCASSKQITITKPSGTVADYINMYKDVAIKEMKRSKIPASITLAQGMLESGNGTSPLATKGNNHFGIKCHSDWKGKKIYFDDDKRNECFRKYENAWESFRDHSDFLIRQSRYKFLFEYKQTDYKSWAKGLKKAGYATNPQYPSLLIKIIEENQLYRFDNGKTDNIPTITPSSVVTKSENLAPDIIINNRIKSITVKEGDTYKSIADANEMMIWEIFKYNDLPKDAQLKSGQQIYLQPKRKKAQIGCEYHYVSEGETMYTISQKYGIKLKKLYEMNLAKSGDKIEVGQKLWLRKKKPLNPESETSGIEFEP